MISSLNFEVHGIHLQLIFMLNVNGLIKISKNLVDIYFFLLFFLFLFYSWLFEPIIFLFINLYIIFLCSVFQIFVFSNHLRKNWRWNYLAFLYIRLVLLITFFVFEKSHETWVSKIEKAWWVLIFHVLLIYISETFKPLLLILHSQLKLYNYYYKLKMYLH